MYPSTFIPAIFPSKADKDWGVVAGSPFGQKHIYFVRSDQECSLRSFWSSGFYGTKEVLEKTTHGRDGYALLGNQLDDTYL